MSISYRTTWRKKIPSSPNSDIRKDLQKTKFSIKSSNNQRSGASTVMLKDSLLEGGRKEGELNGLEKE